MNNSEFRIDELIEECTCILEGDYADDEKAHIDALMCELSGICEEFTYLGSYSEVV